MSFQNGKFLTSKVKFASRRLFASDKAITSSIVSACPPTYPVCYQESCKISPCWNQPRVVIIGAGMAGLSAAKRLADCGLTNFVVVEGKDGPGGRIRSCWLDDTVAELGAQWIKGGSVANPVYTLAVNEGLIKEPFLKRSDLFLCTTSEGRAVESDTTEKGRAIFKKVNDEASAAFTSESDDTKKEGMTLKKFFLSRVSMEVSTLPEHLKYDVFRVVIGFMNDIKVRWGVGLSALSLKNFGSFVEIPGQAQGVPKGLLGTLGSLLKGIPEKSVSYCTEAVKIKWGLGSPRALIELANGDPIPADYVIITVSLGVLKDRLMSMFEPHLPEEKQEAIRRLGFGFLNRLIAHYNKPFWTPGEGFIRLAWSAEELNGAMKWTTGISTIEEVPGSKNKLMTTVASHQALSMEKCSDEQVAEAFTDILRDFTGDQSIPYPTRILRSCWASDKFFRGAGTYMGLRSDVTHQCDLGSPTMDPCSRGPPILLFAGEATAPGLFSTLQGARASGIREADRIINLTLKFRGPPKNVAEC